MRFFERILIAIVATSVMLVPATAAMAESYSGSWPVTVTHAQHGDWTGCLTLADNGGYGWRHSGTASLVIGSSRYPSGSFQVVNHILVATITAQGYSQNAGLVLIGPAGRDSIANGVYDEVYGGSDFNSGALAFGKKGGC
jgi:hypothetical protein